MSVSSRIDIRQELEQALAEHGDRLFALAKRVTGEPDLAADAVQAAFVSALENQDAFRGAARISTWLHRIVYNKSIDILRARGREVPLGDDELGSAALAHAPSWARADGPLAQAELTKALSTAFADLTPVQRAVFEMREEEGQTTEEVAAALGLGTGAVRLHLHRARLKLRARLSEILGRGEAMNCDDLLAKLTDYTEGASDADLCSEIERHLAGCAPCEAVKRDLLELRRLCRSCDPPRLPHDARARIERLLRGEKAGEKGS